ncbi:GNAT family N-acetyltransferase [Alteromonas sp. 5E99-2]|uniref:GNAT family N-acetyltransferase n=1 Tax=Alteromonas sp. 5E99-2 TaxID=2817683 RepID=UPI001A98B5B7|nr:GNAT family N-acetyltransferase [Alteromonas sp. 5E99-2]MBO1255681.1 GNAT family N-acetyltransferase [Alteromonas sp. 5E99-2]
MFNLIFSQPNIEDFMLIRKSIGWRNCDRKTTTRSVQNSLFWVSYYDGKRLIATGRVIGDGAMYFYIQDVIVLPEYQGRGIGAKIMQYIESYLEKNALPNATVGLLAAKGKEGFYKKFNYLCRDGETLGYGFCKFVE